MEEEKKPTSIWANANIFSPGWKKGKTGDDSKGNKKASVDKSSSTQAPSSGKKGKRTPSSAKPKQEESIDEVLNKKLVKN